jgi:hypothetical protein
MASSKRDSEEPEDDPPDTGDGFPEESDYQEEPDRGSASWRHWVQPVCEGLLVVKLILEIIHGNGG